MRTLITALGDKIQVREDVKRIISLSPAVTEILFELGLRDRIVGVSAFCSRPPGTSGIRKVGSSGSARIEVIEELNPDVIYTVSGYPEDFSRRLSEKFPVYVFELPSSVAGIIDLVNKVGIVSERPFEASDIERELISKISGFRANNEIRAYVEIDLGGPVTFGYRSYITDALSLLGIMNIYGGEDREWIEPDLDFVVSSDPEVILYEPKMYSRFTDRNREELIEKRGWGSLSSVKNNAFFVTPGPLDFLAHHGPTFIREVLPWIRDRISDINAE